ncbi:hypothetical protein K439DRAFT_1627409 [Ramaria rubella]|nr:hypothetical protein K439DRAFT_1627409 [Ramaria rubella]
MLFALQVVFLWLSLKRLRWYRSRTHNILCYEISAKLFVAILGVFTPYQSKSIRARRRGTSSAYLHGIVVLVLVIAGPAATLMRLPCHSTHSPVLPRIRSTYRLFFSLPLTRPIRTHVAHSGPSSLHLTAGCSTRMSSAVKSSFPQIQQRSFVLRKADSNGSVPENGSATHHDDEHKHTFFGGHGHDHKHGTDAEKVMEALKGGGDRGSRITLIGLFTNVGLTAVKGTAGWYLHSASLLADAGHSLSDLLGDFVTLFCWQLSRRPRSDKYPYGFGKFETLGTTTVSLLLIGGALGIGFHSYYLLLEALHPTIQSLPAGPLQSVLQSAAEASESIAATAATAHAHEHTLDPNAAWFAAISVVAKEYLYRITKKVADDERSSVLRANAIHHRSDVWSSLVALVAILGSWAIPGLPLDPIGGLIVSVVILTQSIGLLRGAFGQLTDAGVSENTRRSLVRHLEPLFDESSASLRLPHLLSISEVRAVRSGALMFVDLVAVLPANTSIRDAFVVQETIRRRLISQRKEISEVRVKLVPDEKVEQRG